MAKTVTKAGLRRLDAIERRLLAVVPADDAAGNTVECTEEDRLLAVAAIIRRVYWGVSPAPTADEILAANPELAVTDQDRAFFEAAAQLALAPKPRPKFEE